jgi:hypothetical protein
MLKDRIAEALLRNPGVKQADLARHCKVSSASVAGWVTGETKSLKSVSAMKAAQLFGCDQNWLATGTGSPNWRDSGADSNAAPPWVEPIRDDDLARYLNGLPVIEWQELGGPMQFGNEALVTVGTREMAPELMPGDRVEVRRSEPVEPGRLILCRDKADEWHLRRVQAVGGGKWQAVSTDPAAWAPIQVSDLVEVIRVTRLIKAV